MVTAATKAYWSRAEPFGVNCMTDNIFDTEERVQTATLLARKGIIKEFNELPDDSLISRAIAAEILGVKVRTLHNWVSSAQKGPHVFRLSKGTPRYRVGDIRSYIAECAKR